MVVTKKLDSSAKPKIYKKVALEDNKVLLGDEIKTPIKNHNQKKYGLQKRLVFTSPSKEKELEDASNEGCNI